jgi:hypothetical protein
MLPRSEELVSKFTDTGLSIVVSAAKIQILFVCPTPLWDYFLKVGFKIKGMASRIILR